MIAEVKETCKCCYPNDPDTEINQYNWFQCADCSEWVCGDCIMFFTDHQCYGILRKVCKKCHTE